MRYTMVILSALVLLTGVGTAGDGLAVKGANQAQADHMWAQAENPSHRPGRFGRGMGHGGGPPMQKMRRHVEQLRILKLLELLDLDEDQEITVLAAFSHLRKDMRALNDSLDQLIDQLASGLKDSSLSDQEITSLINEIDEIERAILDRAMRFKKEVKPLLTAEQQGKLVVFHYRFEEELLRQVRAFRDKGGLGPPPLEDSLDSDRDSR